MPLETATYVDALVVSNPDGADARATADDHLRLIKASLKRTFPQLGGPVSASHQAISYVNDLSAGVQAQLNALRDGSATAKAALVATSAVSAASAAALGGVGASSFARVDTQNVFQIGQRIEAAASIYHAFYNTSAAPLNRYWTPVNLFGNVLYSYVLTDGGTSGYAWCVVTRQDVYVSSIAFNGGTITFNGIDLTNPVQLNSVPMGSFARIDIAQTFAKGAGSTIVSLPTTDPIAPNCEDGNVFRVEMPASRTIAAPANPRSGQTIVLHIIHTASGNVGYWSSAYKFTGATAPSLSTTAGQVDVFAFNYDSVSGVWRQAGLNVG